MRPITYLRATDTASAVTAVSTDPTSDFLAGGTTEVDLLRQNVLNPAASSTSTLSRWPRSRAPRQEGCVSERWPG